MSQALTKLGLEHQYSSCADKACSAMVKSSLTSIALAVIAGAIAGAFPIVSIVLGIMAIACLAFSVKAFKAMHSFTKAARHEIERRKVHHNPRKIYLCQHYF